MVGVSYLGAIAPKSAGMPWAEAGALNASGQTAASAVHDLAVVAGDTVLIHAAGGVGGIAVQMARAGRCDGHRHGEPFVHTHE